MNKDQIVEKIAETHGCDVVIHPEFERSWHRLTSQNWYWRFRRALTDIRYAPKELLYAWQRARRGWSDRDVWSFDNHLSRVLVDVLPRYRQDPPGEMPIEVWNEKLDIMIDGFKAGSDLDFLSTEEQHKRLDRALVLLKENWGALWN